MLFWAAVDIADGIMPQFSQRPRSPLPCVRLSTISVVRAIKDHMYIHLRRSCDDDEEVLLNMESVRT